jgi:hypothetical protein
MQDFSVVAVGQASEQLEHENLGRREQKEAEGRWRKVHRGDYLLP